MNRKLLIGLIVVVIAAAGGVAALALSGNDSSTDNHVHGSDGTHGVGHDMGEQSSQATGDSAATAAPSATNSVTIADYTYSPKNITVKKGTTVTWTNQDSVAHTVTAKAGTGPDSQLLNKGESYSYTFDNVGSFDYYCKPHPYMTGTVTVTE